MTMCSMRSAMSRMEAQIGKQSSPMQKAVIPVIRENDKDAVIIVGTPTWSQDVDQAAASPISGYKNIMYAFHFYAGNTQR